VKKPKSLHPTGRFCSTAAPVLPQDVSVLHHPLLPLVRLGLQQLVLHLGMPVHQSLYCTGTSTWLSTGAFVLQLDVCLNNICATPNRAFLCCILMCLSRRTCAAPGRVSQQELLCCTWTCLSASTCDAPGDEWSTRDSYGLFLFVLKQLCLFRLFR
jgi:hypothetical protein